MKTRHYTFVLLIFTQSAFSQLSRLDSLKEKLRNAIHDTTRARTLVSLSDYYFTKNMDTVAPLCRLAIQLADKGLEKAGKPERISFLLSKAGALTNIGGVFNERDDYENALLHFTKSLRIMEEIDDKKGIANCLNNIGLFYAHRSEIQKALEYYFKSLKIQEQIHNPVGIALALNNIGVMSNKQGDIPKALDCWNKSLKLYESAHDKAGIANTLHYFAIAYYSQGQYGKALEYWDQSLKFYQETEDKMHVANILNNMGAAECKIGNIAKAMDLWEKSLKLLEEVRDKSGIATSLNNIAKLLVREGQIEKGLGYYLRSLAIRRETGDRQSMINSFTNISEAHLKMAGVPEHKGRRMVNLAFALKFSDSSLYLAKQLGFPEMLVSAEFNRARVDSANGNFKEALEHYKQYIRFKEGIMNTESQKASMKSQLKHEFEKEEAVMLEQQKKEQALSMERSKRQQLIIISAISGLILVMSFAFFVYRSLKTTRHQKQVIEEKQKDILDSIQYAKRIQASLLPPEGYLNKTLKRLKKE